MTILQRPLLSFRCPSGQYVGIVIIFLDSICGINLSGITILSWILFSFSFSSASISPFSIRGIFFSFVVDVILVAPLIDLRSCKIIRINDIIIALTTFGCTSLMSFSFGFIAFSDRTCHVSEALSNTHIWNYIFIV